jgi:anaerobic selenocysteine-containing dehydrogenase
VAVPPPVSFTLKPQEDETRAVEQAAPAWSSNDNSPALFHVSTRRGKQFNTLIHAEVDPLTGASRDAIFINPEDAAALHIVAGERVALVSEVGRYEGTVFPTHISRGNLQVHWPEGNVLIRRGVVDAVGGVPDYNAVVHVERLASPALP